MINSRKTRRWTGVAAAMAAAVLASASLAAAQEVDLVSAKREQEGRLAKVELQATAAKEKGDAAATEAAEKKADEIRAEDVWHATKGEPALKLQQGPAFHPFNFAVLSDLHLSERQGKQRLNKALELIAERKDIAFVLVLGDIVWDRDPEQLKEVLAKAGVPVHLVYGNNDWKWVSNGTYEKAFGPRDYTFKYDNCTFVQMWDCLPKGHFPEDHKGDFSDAQWSWLEQQLKEAKQGGARHIFVDMHIPPMAPGAYDKWFTMYENTEKRFWGLLKQYDVHGAFFGHMHQAISWTHDGIPCFVDPSCCWNFVPPGNKKVDSSFVRIIRVEEKGISDALLPVRLEGEKFTWETLGKYYDPANHPK